MQGPFYIVWESRDNPEIRWINAEFSRAFDAEHYVGDIGGTMHTLQDEGMAEVVERWESHDFSVEAHVWALEKLAMVTNGVNDLVNGELREIGLAEAYADEDPACNAVFRLTAIATEAKMVLREFVAQGTEQLEGIDVVELMS